MTEQTGAYHYALGADIGGTNLRAGLVRSDGKILHLVRRSGGHNLFNLDDNLASLAATFDFLAASATEQGFSLSGIGVAVALPVDRHGVVSSATRPDLGLEQKVDLEACFPNFAGLPKVIENDAKTAAWGEHLYGAGKGTGDLVCLTVGTGIGGGMIVDGRLYHGANGLAGHLGFISVDMDGPKGQTPLPGSLEDQASGTAIRVQALSALRAGRDSRILDLADGEIEQVTSVTVFTAAAEGDPLAQEIIARAGRALGVAAAGLIHIFNPEKVIIGGGVAEQGELLFRPIRETVAAIALYRLCQTPIVPAELGDLAGVIGAAALAGFRDEQEIR